MPEDSDTRTQYIPEIPLETALISVWDKRNLNAFVPALFRRNPELTIISTGGTRDLLLGKPKSLENAGLTRPFLTAGQMEQVHSVRQYGGIECLNGRVKTLFPQLYGGILGDPTDEVHRKEVRHDLKAPFIQAIIVNLYPFQKVAESGAPPNKCFENIDIGGVTLLRAGGKNWQSCLVITDPQSYGQVLNQMQGNLIGDHMRFTGMQAAFSATSDYDVAINHYASQLNFEQAHACYTPVTLEHISMIDQRIDAAQLEHKTR